MYIAKLIITETNETEEFECNDICEINLILLFHGHRGIIQLDIKKDK